MTYGFSLTVPLSYEEALERVKQELAKEGFGIITSIDMRETFRVKLNAEFKKYTILGACNPAFALRALQTDESMGLLLPCNVVVSEKGAVSTVAAFDPNIMSSLSPNPAIQELASEVRTRIERALRALPITGALHSVPA